MRESLKAPECIPYDFAKFERPSQLHVAFIALDNFQKKHKRFPQPRHSGDAEEFLNLAKEAVKTHLEHPIELDDALIKKFSYIAKGYLCPMAAVLGGLVAQEVLKACSGKFHPIYQYFYFDSLESLPKEQSENPADYESNTRYAGQIAVFGKNFHEKIVNAKQFLVRT